jgi:plasmid maintenance system antidote protein VapI
MAEIETINEVIEEISPYYAKLKEKKLEGAPAQEHKLIYQSTSETLEPVYFWTLDLMNSLFSGGKVEKLIDNFTSSPGSGHFSELMGKATKMQEEAMKILANVNTVIKSITNIIYDLKEFEIRLEHYKAVASKNKEKAEAGLLALKQVWMDQVDIKRGRGSINMLVQDLNFVTLRDAFMAAKSVKDAEKMDLNDRIKRILKPRLVEFFDWKKRSWRELQKRYEIERTYLKSQVNALKLYSRWAKPYLKAALQLEQKLEQKEAEREPALVKAFNTILLELTLLGKSQVDFEKAIIDKKLPGTFKNYAKKIRPYHSCVLVDFYFRGIPQKMGQHYVFGGRAEVTFRAYALNENELKMLEQKLDESDLADALKLVSGTTEESLEQLQEDISYFLKEEAEREKEDAEEKEGEDVNPFSALIGLTEKKGKEKVKQEEKEEKVAKVKKDNYVEAMVRKVAEDNAKELCFNLFDVYKKAHGMASHPSPFE